MFVKSVGSKSRQRATRLFHGINFHRFYRGSAAGCGAVLSNRWQTNLADFMAGEMGSQDIECTHYGTLLQFLMERLCRGQ